MRRSLAALAVVVIGVVAFLATRGHVSPAVAKHEVAPRAVGPEARKPPTLRRLPIDVHTPMVMVRSADVLPGETAKAREDRQDWIKEWDEWVKGSNLTAEQEAKALQLIADAQTVYGSNVDGRNEMYEIANAMTNERLTAAQKAVLDQAAKEKAELRDRHKDAPAWFNGPEWAEAQAKAQATMAPIFQELRDTAPAEEQRADKDTGDVIFARDLLADTEAAMGEFLDERQIRAFDDMTSGYFDMLLRARIVRPAN